MPIRVLIIGGTQFMGRHLTAKLLSDTDFSVCLLNRGRTKSPFKVDNERLFHFPCDRFAHHEFRKTLAQIGPCDFIVDFLCFQRSHAKDVVRSVWPIWNRQGDGERTLPQKSLRLYIMISTDSIYMPCAPVSHRCGVKEIDAVRPLTKADILTVSNRDSYQLQYGGNKLHTEQFLTQVWQQTGFPFVALRLPDVIGPFDNLRGFLDFRKRLLKQKTIGLRIGACCDVKECGKKHRISLVFAPDVAKAILQIMMHELRVPKLQVQVAASERPTTSESPKRKKRSRDTKHESCIPVPEKEGTTAVAAAKVSQSVRGQAFNIACKETPSFKSFVTQVARELNTFPTWSPQREAPMVSVDIGSLDICSAETTFGFEPTPLSTVISNTLGWFSERSNRKRTRKLDASSSSESESDGTSSDSSWSSTDE